MNGNRITKYSEDYCISQEEYIEKIASNETYPNRRTLKSDQGGNGN